MSYLLKQMPDQKYKMTKDYFDNMCEHLLTALWHALTGLGL